MTRIGFHASHEQLSPSASLDAVVAAEAAGFAAAMCSDHLAPWWGRPGQSGHPRASLGAALQATAFSMAVATARGQRYYPSVAAEAIARLGWMFPGRSWTALGSGDALNQHVSGHAWSSKS